MSLWKYTFAQLWKQVTSIWKPFPDSWIIFLFDPNSFKDAERRVVGDPRQICAVILPVALLSHMLDVGEQVWRPHDLLARRSLRVKLEFVFFETD